MFADDDRRELCNDLGGESSEEDNEKQDERSPPPYFMNPVADDDERRALVAPERSDSEGEDDPSKLLYHPVVVSTLLNIDFDNYMVHESQNGTAVAKQSSVPSSAASSTSSPSSYVSSPTIFNGVSATSTAAPQPFRFQDAHREFFILESRARPRSTSLTGDIEFFRTRREHGAAVGRHVARANDDLQLRTNAALDSELFAVEAVNSANGTAKACDFHRQKLAPYWWSRTAVSASEGRSGGVAGSAASCSRVVSYHDSLCSCRLSCCCACDFVWPSEDCVACLRGVCPQFAYKYPCRRTSNLTSTKSSTVSHKI